MIYSFGLEFVWLGTCQLNSMGGAMVILEKNSLPSNIKKIKTLPSSTIQKISLPLEGTQICVPLIYGHIFFIGLDLDPYSDIFH